MADVETPEIKILLLGDEKCGKSTFLSKVSQGSGKGQQLGPNIPSKDAPPIYLLRDEDQPFILEVKFGPQSFRLEFYDTASPQTWQLLKPDVIILCFDISSRITLINAQRIWSPLLPKTFDPAPLADTPVLLLGLKRDLRSETDPNGIIYPQEAYRIAQEMRCDKYMECSAFTGELVQEAIEDICKTAVMTVKKQGGGLSEGGCTTM
ncbi:P-loop containing nucleoside triphosphate hydrolase [Glarea lozoyensis ATCC 20868]|uniref:p-loop containing nucleoside triphosphate hydrolase n=1 Tax=Glarea lozoyensis (strain ATCC 20868 / MF5171) TaxID=1116229 RepID=S3DV87_GLAL2|nr:P-loop containing nucleoside triphosphate hydrolase [Glarea lozoyensis ATCC 20868]EPE35846.1 P-loop containing nucleoside triphosphate hydrolase [Glarea lozoyensis ATCC 20868]